MTPKKSKHYIILLFMAAMGAIICGRLFMLCVLSYDKWEGFSEALSQRAVYERAPRGDILDRNGKVLAGSVKEYSVNISRINMMEEEALESAASVLEILKNRDENIKISPEEVREQLSSRDAYSYMPVCLGKDISVNTVKFIESKKLKGVYVSTDYVRDYPMGENGCHVLGYIGSISAEEKKKDDHGVYRNDSMVGKYGIEGLLEERLRGTDGIRKVQVDSKGSVRKLLWKSNVKKGQDVRLTIDGEIQKETTAALQKAIDMSSVGGVFTSPYGNVKMTYAKNAASGAAVVLSVKTGEVLAMVSLPGFDPNDFAKGISEEKWESLQQQNSYDPLSPAPLYNTATMTAVQPGSTFKPVTALAALSCGLNPKAELYDGGSVNLSGRNYGCHLWNESGGTHGYVDLVGGMKVSCNYYFYDIATGKNLHTGKSLKYEKKISNDLIVNYASRLGLGKKSGIELEESPGITPGKGEKKEGIKSSLRGFLEEEQEVYFTKKVLDNRELFHKKIEKIVNWADKDLTLDEIIGKLKREEIIRQEKVTELAGVCLHNYFSQMEWSMGDTFNIAIGQGDNSYTVLQMANYMAALGNDGKRNQVRVISGENSKKSFATGGSNESLSVESGIDKGHIKKVIGAMTEVTSSDGGTLNYLFGDFPYSVAAKTGTAQRAGKKSVVEEREYLRRYLHLIAPDVSLGEVEEEAERLCEKYPDVYSNEGKAIRRAVMNLSSLDITRDDIDRYKESYDSFAWTVALAPAEEPEIALAVMLVQGKTSLNAAPVAREIIGKCGEKYKWEKLF